MFYEAEVEDYIRVEPKLFGLETKEAIKKQLQEIYRDYLDKEIGVAICILNILDVGEGIIIPGDGSVYYNTRFKVLTWKPELQELVYGVISEITNFGAFIHLGAMQGMIHISQTMDDYVSFSKTNSLIGRQSKRSLKKGDSCIARIVAISYKGNEPKIGLTMRQPGLGKIEWIMEEKKKLQKALKSSSSEKKTKEKKESKK